jgi:hypothetical protein
MFFSSNIRLRIVQSSGQEPAPIADNGSPAETVGCAASTHSEDALQRRSFVCVRVLF